MTLFTSLNADWVWWWPQWRRDNDERKKNDYFTCVVRINIVLLPLEGKELGVLIYRTKQNNSSFPTNVCLVYCYANNDFRTIRGVWLIHSAWCKPIVSLLCRRMITMFELCEFSQFIDVFIACSWNEYRCENGQCISQYRRCDGIRDCYDGSDERYCATYTTARATTRSVTTTRSLSDCKFYRSLSWHNSESWYLSTTAQLYWLL